MAASDMKHHVIRHMQVGAIAPLPDRSGIGFEVALPLPTYDASVPRAQRQDARMREMLRDHVKDSVHGFTGQEIKVTELSAANDPNEVRYGVSIATGGPRAERLLHEVRDTIMPHPVYSKLHIGGVTVAKAAPPGPSFETSYTIGFTVDVPAGLFKDKREIGAVTEALRAKAPLMKLELAKALIEGAQSWTFSKEVRIQGQPKECGAWHEAQKSREAIIPMQFMTGKGPGRG